MVDRKDAAPPEETIDNAPLDVTTLIVPVDEATDTPATPPIETALFEDDKDATPPALLIVTAPF